MTRDYTFVSDYCIVIVQDCESSEAAEVKLAEIVKNPKRFKLDSVSGEEE